MVDKIKKQEAKSKTQKSTNSSSSTSLDKKNIRDNLNTMALHYHSVPTAGKLEVVSSKPMVTQLDLSLAYSPGVAEPCRQIENDPTKAFEYTSKNNLVAVISNGTAVLGLGDIGALASKPVMEGKAILFKKFADVNSFDIEVDEKKPEQFIKIVKALEPTFGAINLEDIKAPDCFVIEKALKETMKIPVFHDDQHGTAIVSAAGVINCLKIVKKKIEKVKIVVNGAGSAAIACLDLLVSLGANKKNIYLCDSKGVINQDRDDLNEYKAAYINQTKKTTLEGVIEKADIFLGLSVANTVTKSMVKSMNKQPIIFAMANPNPEISPGDAREAAPDVLIATGRSDYPNQVNNVLCFPYMFRGALDCRATQINEEMKKACVYALADLAQKPPSEETIAAYGASEEFSFGQNYFVPKIFDQRLLYTLPVAVAKAAIESGVATKELNLEEYATTLLAKVQRTHSAMRTIIETARSIYNTRATKIAFTNVNSDYILRAVQVVVDSKIATPVLIGSRDGILNRIERMGLILVEGKDFELLDPLRNDYFQDVWQELYRLKRRNGLSPSQAKHSVRNNYTIFGAMLVRLGFADGLVCGTFANFKQQLNDLNGLVDYEDGFDSMCAMEIVITPDRTFFITDTHVNENPTKEELVQITNLATRSVKEFGVIPKVAMVSHSNFGNWEDASALKMREATKLAKEALVDLEIDGEMQVDSALNENVRDRRFSESSLKGQANVLVMPSIDAANISFNLMKVQPGVVTVGPILLGLKQPIYVLTPSSTIRNIFNLTAVAVVQSAKKKALK